MFDSSYKLEAKSRDEYRLRLPVDGHWKASKQRILVILETVDSQDLAERRLLNNRSRTVLENLLRFSGQQAKLHGWDRRSCAFAAINFNNVKFMDKPKDTWGSYKMQFKKRIYRAIKELEPTHILISGDNAAESLLNEFEPNGQLVRMKRGWVYDLTLAGHNVKVCNTLDLYPLYTPKAQLGDDDDDDEEEDDEFGRDVYAKANLMFYVSDHVRNLMCSKLLFDLSYIKPKPIYVDTIEKFDKLWTRIKTEEIVAVDTETKNLSVKFNAIHTIQFAFEEKKGYLIPVDHPDTPFSPKERRYIKARLRRFFNAKPGKYAVKYLITQYGMFDLRVLRQELGIPVIRHKVWEITAGEYCLDENRTQLAKKPFNTKHGNLQQIFMVYGNDHYKTAAFSKEDRSDSTKTRLDNPDFIEYGCMDVQSIFGIHLMQQERAKYLTVGDKPYLPYYRKLVLLQMSNTVHTLSHMMHKGSTIDGRYLQLLISSKSPLLKLLADEKKKMRDTKEVKRANKLLLKDHTGQQSHVGLFGNQASTTTLSVFNFNKQEHKETLFFRVMGLKPISFTKKKAPQINKAFIKAYEKKHPLVESFGKYQKLSKLWSAYVKGWWNKIQESPDSKSDWKLRASYGFFDVVTGRLNSFDPSLQQVPNRGAEAKYIKRAFVAPIGRLLLKFDYSAHEIRVWSFVSGDEAIAEAFKVGQGLRQRLYLAKSKKLVEKILGLLKKKGDIHIQNVWFFFQKWVDKEHELRDAIKQVVFGVVYAKSAKSLAKDLKKPVEFAQELIEKMFARFKKGAAWLNWTKNHAAEHGYTYAPTGMRRNLHGVLTGVQSIVSAMIRKAANSPIQGLASQIGITAARLITLNAYQAFVDLGYIDEDATDMPVDVVKAVHDALHGEPTYEVLLTYLHVVQWTATYGVTAYYEKEFGLKFTVEPEIEMEIGASEDNMHKWNWTEDHLFDIIKQSLNEQKEIGYLKNVDKAYDKVMAAYKDPKIRRYLEKHYPILGVVKERT